MNAVTKSTGIGHISKTADDSVGRAIFVVGASSVGKTTLCRALAINLAVEPRRYIQETARHVMKACGFTRDHVHLYEMQHAIMTAQIEAEQAILLYDQGSHDNVLLLSDRSAVDPIVYAKTAAVQDSAGNASRLRCDASFQSILPFYRGALFVTEWLEDDGVRSLEDPWKYNSHLCSTLTELDIPFIEISADMRNLKDRVEYVRGHLL
ncbi:hypothetical protein PHLGIDRAFT_74753 [Phlebiopsis gigantea 11061_1 CR5-6]|uniref:NadR/Ttd14 AAA domain-containing protein n=1 Tax=Phlebiopsis gigantea (strain 11061_1 CR5-6) TaxID=745531 RepID=A0A0C3RV82_PHLG1|nr:hypothetical protein PHLGIDRAFT_74753 [Phlebiopsis gigantea 11061_1 CR5-6]